jgi:3-hydroxyacyl-[acyl-carrier-protein] dehydratase
MLDCPEIRRLLPHGHPMTLIDRVLSVDPGRSIVAVKAITAGEPCFQGLERGAAAWRYRYPASLTLESFGQAAALLWLHARGSTACGERDLLMLAAASDCELEGSAFPGDLLRHIARIDRVVGDNVFVDGETHVERRRIARVGSMVAVIRPRLRDPAAAAL